MGKDIVGEGQRVLVEWTKAVLQAHHRDDSDIFLFSKQWFEFQLSLKYPSLAEQRSSSESHLVSTKTTTATTTTTTTTTASTTTPTATTTTTTKPVEEIASQPTGSVLAPLALEESPQQTPSTAPTLEESPAAVTSQPSAATLEESPATVPPHPTSATPASSTTLEESPSAATSPPTVASTSSALEESSGVVASRSEEGPAAIAFQPTSTPPASSSLEESPAAIISLSTSTTLEESSAAVTSSDAIASLERLDAIVSQPTSTTVEESPAVVASPDVIASLESSDAIASQPASGPLASSPPEESPAIASPPPPPPLGDSEGAQQESECAPAPAIAATGDGGAPLSTTAEEGETLPPQAAVQVDDTVLSPPAEEGETLPPQAAVQVHDTVLSPPPPATVESGNVAESTSSQSGPKGAVQERLAGQLITIRLFVCSTGVDMHGERDAIFNEVIPSLNRRYRSRWLQFVAVDMRFGISEGQTAKLHKLFLEEIDRCRVNPDERPWIIILRGKRAGPLQLLVPEFTSATSFECSDNFSWLEEAGEHLQCTPIVSLEILHAVLHARATKATPTHAFAYIRDESFLEDVPEDMKWVFSFEYLSSDAVIPSEHEHRFIRASDPKTISDEVEDVTKALLALDPNICCSRTYKCSFDAHARAAEIPISGSPDATTVAVGRVSGLHEFTNQILADIGASVMEEYALFDDFGTEPLMIEHVAHSLEASLLSRTVFGRQEEVDRLLAYCESKESEHAVVPLIVWGPSGCGTSTVLGQLCEEFNEKHQDTSAYFLISHFTGASPHSFSLLSLLTRVCALIKRQFGLDGPIPLDIQALKIAFASYLEVASKAARVVLVLDAVHSLDTVDFEQTLLWLPQLPPNCRLVVGLAGDTPAFSSFKTLSTLPPPPLEIPLQPLPADAQEELLVSVLDRKTDIAAMGDVLAAADAALPLYLTLVASTRAGASSRESLGAVVDSSLDFLENEHGTTVVNVALTLLTRSRAGLLECELVEVLEAWQWPAHTSRFTNVSRLVSAISGSGFVSVTAGGYLRVAHQLVVDVIRARYSSDSVVVDAHAAMAELFQGYASLPPKTDDGSWSLVFIRGVSELPYHLARSGNKEALSRVLSDLGFIENKCWVGRGDGLADDYLCALRALQAANPDSLPTDDCWQTITAFRRWLSVQGQTLLVYPHATFTQAAGQPPSSIVATAALDRAGRGLEPRPWLVWVNKPQTPEPCLLVIAGHRKHINCCAVFPNGQRVVSGSDDERLFVWDVVTGTPVFRLCGHVSRVECVVVTADGHRIVSGSGDKTIKVWCAHSGKLLQNLQGHTRSVYCVSVSPDSKFLISGSRDHEVKLWDLDKGALVQSTASGHTGSVNSCAFSSTGDMCVTGSRDATLKVWHTTPFAAHSTLTGHKDAVICCMFSPNNTRIVSASFDCSVCVWDVASATVLHTLMHKGPVFACRFSPDGRRVVSCSKDESVLWVWDAESGAAVGYYEGHSHWITCCVYSPDNRFIVTGSRDCTLRLWDTETVSVAQLSFGHSGAVFCVAISPDGRHIASCSKSDNFVQVWNAESGELEATLEGHTDTILACNFSMQSDVVVSGGFDCSIKVWNHALGELSSSIDKAHSSAIIACSYSPAGDRILSGSRDATIKIWAADSLEPLHTLEGASDAIICASWLSDSHVISGSADGQLLVWNVQSVGLEKRFVGHTDAVLCAVYSKKHSRVVSTSRNHELKVWDYDSAQIVASLHHPPVPNSLSFEPAGDRIVAVSHHNTIKVFSSHYDELAVFAGRQPFACVSAHATTGGGLLIAAGDEAGHMYILRYRSAGADANAGLGVEERL